MYLSTSQSNGDNYPIEIPSSKVKLAYVKLTEEIHIYQGHKGDHSVDCHPCTLKVQLSLKTLGSILPLPGH